MKFINTEVKQDFSIKEMEHINKIVLSDKKGNQIKLNKEKKTWYINDNYQVRDDAIKTLLNTIDKIQLKRTVPQSKLNSVIKNLATQGVKIDIYTNNKNPEKTYIIGGNTADHLGTYMILEDSKEPVIMHIPGFHGFLSPRYGIQANQLNLNTWRDTKIFAIDADDIKNISIYHFKHPEKSFIVSTSPYTLKDSNNNTVPSNNKNIIRFLNCFSRLNCQSFSKLEKSNEKDMSPLYQLIINHNTKTDTLLMYSREVELDTLSQKPNLETMYATLNDGEFMIIQSYVFNKVLITIDELKN
ncbi:MAG: DUF4340 domain-containing protein [Bacteroidota bacterium]|nr:DUF4340 domain-containing protein [Bacteroidota bacterium]